MAKTIQVHALIKGRVQGVFFRAETKKAAERIGVKGWVRNLPSGEVEAMFEAEQQKIDQMIAWCHQGSPMAGVSEIITDENPAVEGFSSFDILY